MKVYLKLCMLLLLGGFPWNIVQATPYNIAPKARTSASSSIDAGHDAAKSTTLSGYLIRLLPTEACWSYGWEIPRIRIGENRR